MKTTLGQITVDGKGSYGIAAPAVDYDPNKFTYLRITDINDDGSLCYSGFKSVDDENAEKYLLHENDIVFARTGASTGRSYFYEKHHGIFVYAGFLIKFSLDPQKVNPKILKYYTHSKEYYDWIRSFDTGATRGNINAQTLANMPLELPERKDQDKIVSILSSLDRKIELNNQINKQLEEMAQAIFKSWFIDFEPFKDGEFVDSELGRIPKGWRVGKILDLASRIGSGGTPKSNNEEYYKGDIPWFGTGEFNDSFIIDSLKHITKEATDNSSAKVYPSHTVLIAMYGATVGKLSILSSEAAFNQAALGIVAKDCLYYPFIFLTLLYNRESLIRLACGAAQQNLNAGIIKQFPVIIPTEEILTNFCEVSIPFFSKIESIQKESRHLSTLRDTLLPKLMSGEINLEQYGNQ